MMSTSMDQLPVGDQTHKGRHAEYQSAGSLVRTGVKGERAYIARVIADQGLYLVKK
jgi:hypothetical protein